MALLVIYNPVCGDSTAEQFFNTHVIPRLHAANRTPTEVICTRSLGDAGKQTLDFLSRHKGDITIVLGSGDGTLHEIVNCFVHAANGSIRESDHSFRPVYFVLVPCGTANAIYASFFRPPPAPETVAYRMQSLEAFLGTAASRPLSLSLTSFVGPLSSHPSQSDPLPVASIVVASTALHAAILKDSEKLRKEIPGIERFKVAARQNITNWYASTVKLLPSPSSGLIYTYDPKLGDFIPFDYSNESASGLEVHGPFSYFLSTVNVDRLEHEFRISPMISKKPPTGVSMDVVMVRPQRDPTSTLDTPGARENFAEKIAAVFHAAYRDGVHINLRYSESGDITERGDGNTVVECFRCGGWEWTPCETDEDAHLLCTDGTVFEIEKAGRATCRVTTTSSKFYIYV